MMSGLVQAWTGLIAICLLYAAACDISVRLIPNRLSAAVIALALPFRLLNHDLVPGIAVTLVMFTVLTGVWLLHLIGGGDVKFWTACSLLIPPSAAAQGLFSLRVILFGGGVAMAYLMLRLLVRGRRPIADPPPSRHWIVRVWRAEQWRARRRGSIPYGVAIALSAWVNFTPMVPR
ncbi:prepilin peptidase [Acidiphilium sp. PA]|uniref:A24 family peptidase n=1 Tax=Acidiphilium sp. PA TaxID=2871705 RepID=UPI002243F545|nr:prepilin peptidase [Acidiphilium sp. PA]MCW8306378.1 prepilin peptidase [Acidiphilium sp. PA]